MTSGIKKYELKRNKILKIELFNPKKNNAISLTMLDELIYLLNNKKYLNNFNFLVLSGYNNGPYSSGADLDDIKKLIKNNQINIFHKKINKIIDLINNLDLLLLSFIKSYCYGAGFILALQSDILIADKKTKFCIPATNLKIEIPIKQINNLKKKINIAFLTDILITSRVFSASEAHDNGIISYLIESKNYMKKKNELLNIISSKEKKIINYYLKILKKK